MIDYERQMSIIRKSKRPRYHTSDDAINQILRQKNKDYDKNKKNRNEPRQYDKDKIRKYIGFFSVVGWTVGNTVGTIIGLWPMNHPFKYTIMVIGLVAGFFVGVGCGTLFNFLAETYIDSLNIERERRGIIKIT
jgi:heme O synthase-like polyprenyltransferase